MSMFTEHINRSFPHALRSHLEAAGDDTFVRRSVLVRDANTKAWCILGCVVKPQADGIEAAPELHDYGNVTLVVDLLTAPQCVSFIEAMSTGGLSIAGREITFQAADTVEVQKQPVRNWWMEEAGFIFTFASKLAIALTYEPLVKIGSPYFPDAYEAVKHWGALRKHGGATDQTNNKVVVLIPETRGFVRDFSWEGADDLHLELAGTEVGRQKLQVLGAFWCGQDIGQLRARVADGRAQLKVGSAADRLELFVVSETGAVYEHHLERLGPNPDHSRFLTARSRTSEPAALANAAAAKGEGPDVEYKEWVDPDVPLKGSKLYKLLRAVAAFSNTQGGTIVIGVDDTSEVIGIEEPLRQWSQQDPDEAAANRYVGALRSRITNSLDILPDMSFAVTKLKDKLVVVLRVAKSKDRIGIGEEGVLYVRKSGTNKKLAPNEWPPKEQSNPFGE